MLSDLVVREQELDRNFNLQKTRQSQLSSRDHLYLPYVAETSPFLDSDS